MRIIEDFIEKESSSGIILIVVTVLALALKNSPVVSLYEHFLHIPIEIRVGPLHLDKSLYHWINDGLMTIFFLLVGLEIKREVLEGQLSSVRQAILPGVAAFGGMLFPALIYTAFNYSNPVHMRGWGIPTATDIAFALGVLSLLGKRIPESLKVFLMALAIIDDLGAILIIAIFYTGELSSASLIVAGISLIVLVLFNVFGVSRKAAYFLVGTVLWISVLKSGVHATLAGVALAFTIPLKAKDKDGREFSPSKEIEEGLHNWVAFMILPLFAFVNAGVDMGKVALTDMISSVPLGVFFGLVFGKQLGVFLFSWAAVKTKLARLPKNATWMGLYGVSVLTGIGFTMSLFIDSLAFESTNVFYYANKLSILLASFTVSVAGYLILRMSSSTGSGK